MDNEITVTEPTRQKLACQGRSLPGKVTGKLKIALDAMVWQAASRKEAALVAGLTDHSLRQALRRPHVMSHYLAECEVLRLSGRAKRLHRLDELAGQDTNRNAAVAAIKPAEGIADENHAPGRSHQQFFPGVTIVITGNPRAPDREPLTIDVDGPPSDRPSDGRSPNELDIARCFDPKAQSQAAWAAPGNQIGRCFVCLTVRRVVPGIGIGVPPSAPPAPRCPAATEGGWGVDLWARSRGRPHPKNGPLSSLC